MKKRLIWLCLGMALCLVACNDNGKNNNQGNDEPKVEEVDVTKDPLDLLNDSITMDENRPDLYLRRASILMSREQVGMAMMDVNKAIQLDPKNVDALLMLSDIYVVQLVVLHCLKFHLYAFRRVQRQKPRID